MNGNRQMEMHYINSGFPYSITESFMDFFEGLTHVPVHYVNPGPPFHDQLQENAYWSMNMNAYKYGFSDPGSTYYTPYEVNDNLPSTDAGRGTWEYPSVVNMEEPTTADTPSEGDGGVAEQTSSEECIPNHTSSESSEGFWQDDIDPDNMTYEELLDLGETVGTQSRGLSQELINLLPTSRCKFGIFFSKKKARERCVICQMRYKRGQKQMKLPCRHFYHSACITKWLSINKAPDGKRTFWSKCQGPTKFRKSTGDESERCSDEKGPNFD